MILKGSQRANGADLATHLMQTVDNETVEIAQVRGTVATDLHGAFSEMEAVAAGTKAKNYLYSLSINPSAPLTRDQYFEAIAIIECSLGLAGQPRAVIFHVKDGREHCHVVWSKIDALSMKAIHMAYDHAALCDLSCALARQFGLALPPGLIAWEAGNPSRRYELSKDRLEPTLAENAITKETGVSVKQREAEITAAYNSADGPRAFQVALVQSGYILAQGDRRRYVVVDRFAKVHSLTRYIRGHTAKSIKFRLQAALAFADLPTVDEAKDYVRQHQQDIQDQRGAMVERAKDQALAALQSRQAERRRPLGAREQDLLIRHAAERMALHAAQSQECLEAVAAKGTWLDRLKNAVLGLIVRSPALRSILGHIANDRELDLTARHALENHALAARHATERAMIAREYRSLAAVEARELKALKQALRRGITDTGSHSPSLMSRPLHEHEDLHRLHERLIDHRRRKFQATFNACANPRKRRAADERPGDLTMTWDWQVRPRTKPRGT